MNPIIHIQNLTKRFGSRTAVDHLTLSIESGDIFGFVGPNGAGKTSTIRMMATLLQPTEGAISILGHSVSDEPAIVRQAIGYMPDYFGVYHDLTVREYLDFFAACYRIPSHQRKSLISDLLELVELSHRQEDSVDRLSRGMQQRLSLARTLIHDPQVLILDEPAAGLDPRARVEIRQLMMALSKMGKTIFFSTHILADVAEICSRVGILEAGKLVALGSLESLQQQILPRRQVEITLLDRLEEAIALLASLPGITGIQPGDQASTDKRPTISIEFSGDDAALSQVLNTLVEAEIPVLHFHEDQRDLEAIFLHATQGLVT